MPAWSGLWNDVYADGVPSLVQSNTLNREISRAFRRTGGRKLRALFIANLGAAPGVTALATRARVAAIAGINGAGAQVDLGGVRPIEIVTEINRATTAADVTAEEAMVNQDYTFTRVADRSGNGAGGQRGY